MVGSKVVVKAFKNHAGDGEHLIIYYSVDNALNEEIPKTTAVKIDTRP